MTDLFVVTAHLDRRGLVDAIPPSVRRGVDPTPVPQRDGDDVVLELGPWMPRAPARHLLPSLALLTSRPYSARFELSGRRSGAWCPWVASVTLGDGVFAPLASTADGLTADIDEITAAPPVEAVRLRVRLRAPDGDAVLDVPWLVTLSTWDGAAADAGFTGPSIRLAVPARTQMAEPDPPRMNICSPTSVAMTLEYFGCTVPTLELARDVFHAPTNRYGVWPAAVRAAAARGVPGYLLRFSDWDAVAWCLGRGLPIVASVRFAAGELASAPIPDTTGHLLVVTGLDGDDVLVNDPAAPSAETVARRYRREEFSRVWLARAGVGYVFLPPAV